MLAPTESEGATSVMRRPVGFDPLQAPLPPELAPAVYGVVRRLALQSELAGADRLLRELAGELTSSLSVIIVYPGPEGATTLGPDGELTTDREALRAVAAGRRAIVASHLALIPIANATDTVAVLVLSRHANQPAYTPIDQLTMAALARESAGILHHLVVQHWQRAREAAADEGGLYRAEALDSHRSRGQEGALAELSPGWVRRTYPVLVIAMVLGIAATILVRVPTYSSGTGVVVFQGTPITAPMPGTVDTVYVRASQQVHAGDVLVKLASAKEDADLAQARTELDAATDQYLFDSTDEAIRKSLVSAQAAVRRAEAAVGERTVRATRDGTVSDVRIRPGTGVQFGDPILTIVEPGTDPEIWAFLPGSDRPRLRPGMDLQVELAGFTKARETAKIVEVGGDVIGAAEARRSIGAEIADAVGIKQEGSYVLVKAHLPTRTFTSDHRIYRFHQGMPARTEVRVVSRPFLVTLVPSLERYL